jgi:hypothetical protein
MMKNDPFDMVMSLSPQDRLSALIMSVVEMHRTTPKIAESMLNLLVTMSTLHGQQMRAEVVEMMRNAADVIERPMLTTV